MTGIGEDVDAAFLEAAGLALRASQDRDPLDALGWWDLLTDLADRDARTAALALFRAQGRELRTSAALGGLVAQPFLAPAGICPGQLVATVNSGSARGARRLVVVGDVAGRSLLVDRPGHGAAVIPAAEADLRPIGVAGRLVVQEVGADLSDLFDPSVPSARIGTIEESQAAPARARGRFLGRLALALEILGAAEGALAIAIEHAGVREQFGRPIGTFQAVRHLLAWAQTDCVALSSVAAAAVRLDEAAPARHDEVVKALAGRNGRRVCETALQVLGAIGFTQEHIHHHFHRRVLALDALMGTSADLTYGLGTWLRDTRADPALPAAELWREPWS